MDCDSTTRGMPLMMTPTATMGSVCNSPISAQILVGLTTCSFSLGKSRFTIRRSRLISIRNNKKRIPNQSRIIRGFKPESILIIMSNHLKHIEKRENKLQVICTAWSWDLPLYPSALPAHSFQIQFGGLVPEYRDRSWYNAVF